MTNDTSDVRSQYSTTPDGRITSSGQFEGEMIWVPFYWNIFLEGNADRDNGRVLGFDVSAADRQAFPEMPKRKRTIRLYQRDDGFVCEC